MSERGVLLVNLGSPKSTQVADVRRYLNQFLMDPYVVDLPWPARRLLVSLILLTRPKASAHAYASIWWEDGSPLLVISRRVQQALQQQLDMPVELAMRYGEPSIEQGLLQLLGSAQSGDQIDLEMFYLSSRPVIEALIAAHQRGATLRVILDPNRDAFGREKNGIPNRQAAWDLHEAGIPVRWCATEGEQCHRKWIRLERTDGSAELIAGSANFTRRNLHDLNLETSVRLVSRSDSPQISEQRGDFEREWHNANGATYSLPYADFADHSRWRYLVYRFMEASGLSTF